MKSSTKIRVITGLCGGFCFFGTYFLAPVWAFSLLLGAILGIILFFEWPALAQKNPSYWLFISLYPVFPFLCLILLNQSPYRNLLLLLFLFVFLFDSASYFVGISWGKHKLVPKISPWKTWEGFLGGLLITTLIGSCILLCGKAFSFLVPFLIGLICLLALMGDLFESYLKRKAGLKDSGAILPGHGGLLDRFDAAMAVAIFFYFGRTWLWELFF